MTGIRATAPYVTALCATLLLGATACGSSSSGPTSAEAGKRMSQDARGLLGNLQNVLKAPAPYTVSQDSAGTTGASVCGSGKERRSFAGQVQVPATPTVHAAMALDSGDANGYLVQHGYTPAKGAAPQQSDRRRTDVMLNKKAGTTITAVLTPAPDGKLLNYLVTGTTDCLSSSS